MKKATETEIVKPELITTDRTQPELITNNPIDHIAAPDKQELLIRNICLGLSTKQAALDAGYSESTAESSIYQMIKKPNFQTRLREYILAHNIIDIPRVINLESRAIEAIEEMFNDDEPDKAIDKLSKLSATFKRKLQDAGLSEQDETRKTINISGVQNLMLQVHEGRMKEQEGE